jgi:hypothetical protein
LPWGTLTEIRDFWLPPNLRRRLGLALSFVGFGLIAGTSGVALIVADTDSDPRKAFALAPAQTPTIATAAAKSNAEEPLLKAVIVREVEDSNGTTREIAARENVKSCPGVADRCGSEAGSNSEAASSLSTPPASAALRSRDDNKGTNVAELHRAASVESAPAAELSATVSSDSAPAAVEAPAPEAPVTKPRKTARQQSGQRHAYQHSSGPRRGRYAQHPFWPFW